MAQDELNHNHPNIAKRIVGAIAVDERLTEDHLLAQARAFYQAMTNIQSHEKGDRLTDRVIAISKFKHLPKLKGV